MTASTVFFVRTQEHNQTYTEFYEDIRIGYLQSILNKLPISTCVFDFAFEQGKSTQENVNTILDAMVIQRPLALIFFVDKHPTNNPYYVIEILKNFPCERLLSTHVSLYGNTQINTNDFFSYGIDSVILGEEESAYSLINSLLNKEYPNNVVGVTYRDGIILKSTPVPKLLSNLDDLPYPTRYHLNSSSKNNYVAAIQASRGCFGKCNYCHLRAKEKYFGHYPWRGRTEKNIVEEIQYLYDKFGVKDFFFTDEQFFASKKDSIIRSKSLAEELQSRQLNIRFSIYTRADSIDEKSMTILKKVGLYCVFLGVESFCQDVLDRYEKNISVNVNFDAINILKKLNIRIRLGYIFFDHYTTVNEIKNSIDALKEITKTKHELIYQSMFFSNVLIPLHNTPYYDMINKNIDSKKSTNLHSPLHEKYRVRSRNDLYYNEFKEPIVENYFNCISYTADRLLTISLQFENDYNQKKNKNTYTKWFSHLTKYEIKLLDSIYNKIILDGTSCEECYSLIDDSLQVYTDQMINN